MSETTGNTPRKTFNKVVLPSVTVEVPMRLGSAPESRYTPAGQLVCSFRAVASRRYQKDGAWVSVDAWFKIAVWREAAERLAAKNLAKGDIVLVEFNAADLKAEAYTDKNGNPAASMSVNANRVQVIATNSEAAEGHADPAAPNGETEDEIPF